MADAPGDPKFTTPATLDRYLTARDHDVTRAARQLQATLQWRVDYGTNALDAYGGAGNREDGTSRGKMLREQAESGKMAVLSETDNEGRAIIIMRSGLENSKDTRGKIDYLVYTLERASALADAAGAGQYIVISDYTVGSMSMANMPNVSVMRETTNILQGHYPERLAKMVLVGAPMLFHGLFKVIRPVIDVKTRDKLVFVDAPQDVAKLDGVDAKTMPTFYGGEMEWEFNIDRYFDEDVILPSPESENHC